MNKRQQLRNERKAAKIASRENIKLAKIAKKQEGQQARIAKRAEKNASAAARRAAKNVRVSEIKDIEKTLPADLTGAMLPLKAKTKAVNYLKKRNRVVEDENDGDILAAQYHEERQRQIAERHDEIENEIDENPAYTEDEKDELVPEYEDVNEMLLNEEANQFAFDGDEDNFVDPETAAMLLRVGKAGVEKYKEKRFKAGKKAFGRTAAQDAAIKAKKALGGESDAPLSAAAAAAMAQVEKEKTAQATKEYTPYIIGAAILLLGVGFAVAYSTKK